MLGKGTDVCKDPNDQRAALLLITGIDSLACVCSRVEYACMHACERMTGRYDDYSESVRKIAVQREAQGTWATRGNREQFHVVSTCGRGRSESRKTLRGNRQRGLSLRSDTQRSRACLNLTCAVRRVEGAPR